MATIGKLMLSGIRSFGPNQEDMQTVKFESPLTLFLGENGCGKTTIIEALKFACSGDLPGGTKGGQGFVNEPRLSNRACTKGQVRLSLIDPKGCQFIVIKSVQVQNKASTSSFKRLDSTLKRVNPEDNSTTTISSRCADIDTDICEILGVSKAIINNVIFCHQENAAWPLDEPKKLKEKFDEIFGATEYNKCTESIRSLIKEQESQNKIKASKVAMLQQTKDIVDRKHSELNEKMERLANSEEIIKKKQDDQEPINKRLQEICELEDNIGNLQSSCTKKETMKNAMIEQQKLFLKNIDKEYEGTDEELRKEIESFEVKRGLMQDKLKNLEKEKRENELHQQKLSQSINNAQIQLGKLESAKKQQEDRVKERNEQIESCTSNFNIQIGSLELEDNVINVINGINKSIDVAKSDFGDLMHKCDDEETRLQELIDTNREQLLKVNHDIVTKNKQIQELKSKGRNINSQLRELDYSDEQLKLLQSKIAQIDSDLASWKNAFDVNAVTESIETDKQKTHQIKAKLETLEREHRILLQNSINEAELETQKLEIIKREAEIDKLNNKHFEHFGEIFKGDIPNPGFIQKSVENYKQTNSNKINDLNKKIMIKQKETTTLETKCRYLNEKLASLENELEGNREKVFQVCKGNSFDKTCTELHQFVEQLQKEKGQYSSAKIMYEKFVKDFQSEKPCCPICQTNFTNKQNDVTAIIDTIRTKILGIPQELQKVEENLKLKQAQYSKILQLKPINDKIEELDLTVIPKTRQEKDELNNLHNKIRSELEELTKQIVEPQVIVDACNKVIGDAALIDQHHLEINRSQRKIENLKLQLIQLPSNRSRQQTEAEIQDLRTEQDNAFRNVELSEKKLRQHNDRCHDLREEKSRHVEKQLQLQKAMQGKPQLEEHLIELNAKEESLTNEIGELQLLLVPLKAELKESEDAKAKAKLNNRKQLNEAQNKLDRYKKIFEDIKKLQTSIDKYIQADGDGSLKATEIKLDDLKTQAKSLDTDKQQILDKITGVNKQLANQDGGYRTLNDNLNLREKRKEAQHLTEEILEIKRQIGSYNYRTLLEEKQRLQTENDNLRREISRCIGRNDELKQEITKLTNELNTTENKRAHINFKKAYIEHVVNKEAVANLQFYLKALERGVLEFHKERMNQINKIIRQLWRTIYRGNDCDYIEIKTEETKITSARRTYNYKVIQMKNNVEIEMRGRCSAGQKVLACLIIRMALAETFSKNCGILALDEPTTNLDRENIKSLSNTLAQIVQARQFEKNFQLLIITHDEEFLSALSKVDKVSHFWRVSRNDNGNSVISKDEF